MTQPLVFTAFLVDLCFCQIFQEVPIGIGMPMMMPMQYQFIANPFDQGFDIEYSPITQLVSSVAHLVEMHQKHKERAEDRSEGHQNLLPEMFNLESIRGRPGVAGGPRFNLIPFTQDGLLPSSSQGTSSTSKLINSIPNENIPPVMWRIGDLLRRNDLKQKENVYDTSKIKGFPIVKNSEDVPLFRDSEESVSTPKSNKSWTILEIARKILGVDEIPTASEGNAVAQLLEELRKDKGA
ncbi:unnamed protein product [Caenorhabditis sp. 36 PRJEB53466]|nr:unnamed protein product [Caenorhabditis sp. 36 PRJEB53466]